jgi:hypothetical protein
MLRECYQQEIVAQQPQLLAFQSAPIDITKTVLEKGGSFARSASESVARAIISFRVWLLGYNSYSLSISGLDRIGGVDRD